MPEYVFFSDTGEWRHRSVGTKHPHRRWLGSVNYTAGKMAYIPWVVQQNAAAAAAAATPKTNVEVIQNAAAAAAGEAEGRKETAGKGKGKGRGKRAGKSAKAKAKAAEAATRRAGAQPNSDKTEYQKCTGACKKTLAFQLCHDDLSVCKE